VAVVQQTPVRLAVQVIRLAHHQVKVAMAEALLQVGVLTAAVVVAAQALLALLELLALEVLEALGLHPQ